MVDDYKNNIPTREIMEKYKVTTYKLYIFLREHGIVIDKEQKYLALLEKRFSKLDVESLKADYLSKSIDMQHICNKYNIAFETLVKLLKREKIYMSKEETMASKRIQAMELYASGVSCNKIGQLLQTSSWDLGKLLKNLNIPIRGSDFHNRKYDVNHSYYDNIDAPEKAHILGLLLSDGHINIQSNNISISLQEDDIDTIKYIKHSWNAENPIYHSVRLILKRNIKMVEYVT